MDKTEETGNLGFPGGIDPRSVHKRWLRSISRGEEQTSAGTQPTLLRSVARAEEEMVMSESLRGAYGIVPILGRLRERDTVATQGV
jgi:hypothetical protein